MRAPVTVACVQAEPVIFDRAATIDKLAALTAEAAAAGAQLVVFPETFVPAYPSLGVGEVPRRLGRPAREGRVRAARPRVGRACPAPTPTGSARSRASTASGSSSASTSATPSGRARSTTRSSTTRPDGELALHHRKLVPTNHERLVWGQGDGGGLRALETPLGRIGGLICWENYMPLARFALYESGVEIYVASTADDGDAWQATLVHIARESRAFVVAPCHFQRAVVVPGRLPATRRDRRASTCSAAAARAILAPDGSYLAGPLYDEEGILYAELDPERLYEERQRFDPAGHYHRPDVLAADGHPLVTPAASASILPGTGQ